MFETYFKRFLPSEPKQGKRGFYPVTNSEEWSELPNVFKAMEWFPREVYNGRLITPRKEMSVPEYVIFDVTYLYPYGVSARVRVHIEDFQKIMYCLHNHTDCQLYSVCGVEFANGVEWGAYWEQDMTTGAFAVYANGGHLLGKQGGFNGFIPSNIEETEDGFKWNYEKGRKSGNRCTYELSGNPFR